MLSRVCHFGPMLLEKDAFLAVLITIVIFPLGCFKRGHRSAILTKTCFFFMIFVSFRYPWAPSCIFYLVAFSSSIHPVPESGVLGSWTVLGRLVLDGVGSLGPMALAAVGSHGWPWLAIAGHSWPWLAMAGHSRL